MTTIKDAPAGCFVLRNQSEFESCSYIVHGRADCPGIEWKLCDMTEVVDLDAKDCSDREFLPPELDRSGFDFRFLIEIFTGMLVLSRFSNHQKDPISLDLTEFRFENFNELTEAELEQSFGEPIGHALNPYMTSINACLLNILQKNNSLNGVLFFDDALRLNIDPSERKPTKIRHLKKLLIVND